MYRVGIVDDLEELRRLLRRAVERTGRFEVCGEASDGLEAVILARDEQPDVLLLDVSMPLCDGLEALPQICEAAPRTTVVMLSGFEATRLEQTALRLGASAYLEKGMPPNQLVSALLQALGDEAASGTTGRAAPDG